MCVILSFRRSFFFHSTSDDLTNDLETFPNSDLYAKQSHLRFSLLPRQTFHNAVVLPPLRRLSFVHLQRQTMG